MKPFFVALNTYFMLICYCWPSQVVIVPDEQGYAYKSQNEFKGYDKDILHSDNGFIS